MTPETKLALVFAGWVAGSLVAGWLMGWICRGVDESARRGREP